MINRIKSWRRGCRYRRWSDDNTWWGPFTYSSDCYAKYAIILESGDEEGGGCSLRFSFRQRSLIIELPNWVLRPYREQVKATYWNAETVERMGRDWYWDVHSRRVGFSYSTDDHFLTVHWGHEDDMNNIHNSKSWFMPWREYHMYRHVLQNLDGSVAHDVTSRGPGFDSLACAEDRGEMAPQITFAFADFDGEIIQATCHRECRRWHRGTGKFRWLRYFMKGQVRNSLEIQFSRETGKRKGSWKGGTIGHGIEMMDGEAVTDAFKRYCQENKMTYLGVANSEEIVK